MGFGAYWAAGRVRSAVMHCTRRRGLCLVAILGLLAAATACSSGSKRAATTPSTTGVTRAPAYRLDDSLRLNQIQVLGSHNSYHASPYPQVLAALRGVNPATAAGLDYGHRPLPAQFDLGVRQIELDVWADPNGGKYARPTVPTSLHIAPPDP